MNNTPVVFVVSSAVVSRHGRTPVIFHGFV